MNEKETTITDLYSGEYIEAWEDEEAVCIAFILNGVCVMTPIEDFPQVARELAEVQAEFQARHGKGEQ